MKKYGLAFICFFLLPAITGCIETKQEFIINPDDRIGLDKRETNNDHPIKVMLKNAL